MTASFHAGIVGQGGNGGNSQGWNNTEAAKSLPQQTGACHEESRLYLRADGGWSHLNWYIHVLFIYIIVLIYRITKPS